ncbi:MAG TPA: hypothetical protein VIH67_15055, partial [Candidatus Acidoferrum sp.]
SQHRPDEQSCRPQSTPGNSSGRASRTSEQQRKPSNLPLGLKPRFDLGMVGKIGSYRNEQAPVAAADCGKRF